MGKKFLKWTIRVIASIVLVASIFYAIVYFNTNSRMNKKFDFDDEIVDIAMDSITLAEGAHLAKIRGCEDCHGTNLGGKLMIDDAVFGTISASNLTSGTGGLPGNYSERDWMRSLRHGVAKNGRPFVLMPSHESTLMSDKDLAALIAYCSQVKPIDNVLAPNRIGPVMRIMAFFDKFPFLPAEKIEHYKPVVILPAVLSSSERGKYLSVSCQGCHRSNLKGGEGFVPGAPAIPDISRSGAAGSWTLLQFKKALKTGIKPSGVQMNDADMPWKMTAQYKEEELQALYDYLQTIP